MSLTKKIFTLMVAACLFAACSDSDDEVFATTTLTGTWDLVEVLNGPAGFCDKDYKNSYPSGTVIIELKADGTFIYDFEDGVIKTVTYSIPENQELYHSTVPVVEIDEVPFGYVFEENRLKLHYFGTCTCDHIPATFVFKRIK